MKKQKGFAPMMVIVIIGGALAVGFIFKLATKHIDHPLEQVSEKILADHGIDIDFSKDKKNKLRGK